MGMFNPQQLILYRVSKGTQDQYARRANQIAIVVRPSRPHEKRCDFVVQASRLRLFNGCGIVRPGRPHHNSAPSCEDKK